MCVCVGISGLKVRVFCEYDGVFVCVCVYYCLRLLMSQYLKKPVLPDYAFEAFEARLQSTLSLTAVVPAVKICVHTPASIHTHNTRTLRKIT